MKPSHLIRSATAVLVVLALFPAAGGWALSQTTITSADFVTVLAHSQRMEYTMEYFPNPSVDLGLMSPAAQVFDFSAIPNKSTRDSIVLEFVDPAGHAGESYFPGATLCTPQVFNPTDSSEIIRVAYYLVQPDGFYLLGQFIRQVVSTILDTAVVLRLSPKKLLLPFPLAYGVMRTGVDTSVFDSLNNDFAVTLTTIECDGWGDVTPPPVAGAALNCLRVTRTEAVDLFFDGSFAEREKRVEVEYITPEGVLLTVAQNDSDYAEGVAAVTTIVHSLRIGTTGLRNVPEELPRTLTLSQNYPNPFNPATTIGFSVPSAGRVRMEIFDMLGRAVATPVHSDMPPGSYVVDFDASRLPSGIYVYRLTAAGATLSKKLNVVK